MYSEQTLRRRARTVNHRVTKGVKTFDGVKDSSGEIGYMLENLQTGVLDGIYNGQTFDLSLEDVERLLKEVYEAEGRKW